MVLVGARAGDLGAVMGVRLVFLAVFFASGTAALLYQVIWQRLLTFTTGADVYSVTIVVAAFMAGMGVGSLAGGHVADRLDGRRRLHAFAACEIAIALFALASATLYYDWLYARLGARDLSWAARGVLSFAATLWPTFFMGMSLPLAARAMTDDARQPARWVPLLYGWNTLGAGFGAVLAVAVLFRTMDFESSLRVGATLSFTCAIAALAIAWRLPARTGAATTSAPESEVTSTAGRPGLRGPVALYALSGFIALSLEVVWFRVLGVMLKSTALTFGHLLAIYLGGLGLGSLAANARRVQAWPARRGFLLSQAAIPLYAALALAALVATVGRVGALQPLWEYLGRYEPLSRSEALSRLSLVLGAAVPLFLMGPPTFLMGFSFGFLQRDVQTDLAGLGRRVGWLQAANIAGAVAGALLTGLVLLNTLGTSGTLRVLVSAGGVFLWLAARGRWRVAALAAVIAVIALVPSPSRLWPSLHGTRADTAVFAEDSSGVALLRRNPNGTTTVHAHGLGQSQLPFGGIHTVLGALPVLLHPAPVRIAVIGLGSGDTTWSVGGREETREIDSIEIVAPALTTLRDLALVRPYPGLNQLLLDRRVRHHLTDGRAFLLKTDRRYDVIEADALRPNSAYAGNLYSVEYFTLLRSRLSPGGFAVTWTPTPRVVDSVVAAFPHVLVAGSVAIGSDGPIPFDPAVVRARMTRQFTEAYYAAGRVHIADDLAPLLEKPPTVFGPETNRDALVNVNRDLFPRDEFKVRASAGRSTAAESSVARSK
jgi:spermidine synthase/MFS family permease